MPGHPCTFPGECMVGCVIWFFFRDIRLRSASHVTPHNRHAVCGFYGGGNEGVAHHPF